MKRLQMRLSPGELHELRAELIEREQQLLSEINTGMQQAASEHFTQIAGEAPDNGDASVADLVIDRMSAERTRDAEELRDVEEALGRIDAGAYGLCLECGEPIDIERLRANPSARYDLQHQQLRERGKVRTPSL